MGVERLFPFALRARILIVGQDALWRHRSRLQFILATEDLSEGSLEKLQKNFAAYPIVRAYSSGDLEKFFHLKNAKVLGFKKSDLSSSLYRELKGFRINLPPK